MNGCMVMFMVMSLFMLYCYLLLCVLFDMFVLFGHPVPSFTSCQRTTVEN